MWAAMRVSLANTRFDEIKPKNVFKAVVIMKFNRK